MKKLYTIVIVLVSAVSLSLLSNSCTNMPDVIEELNLSNVLTPTSNSATISQADGRTTTFTWSSSSTATNYILEIYRWDTGSAPDEVTVDDEGNVSGSIYETITVEQGSGTTTSYAQYLEPDYSYYARVKGQNLDDFGAKLQGDSNWSEFRYPIEPYLVMDALPSFEVTDRTSSSITLAWTAEDGDSDAVNQIRVSPNPDNASSSYKTYTVSTTDRSTTVDGLKASTMYTIYANFNSATRNTITAWTKTGANGTTVTTSEELQAAITGGQSPIIVAYSDDPYVIDDEFSIGDTGNDELYVYGDGLGDGTLPKVHGKFTLASGTSIKTIHLESLALVGDSSNNVCVFSIAAGDYTEVSMLNCTVDSYLRGIINAGSNDVNIEKFDLNAIYSTNITGDGGGFIDFRGATETAHIGTFSITNSTFDGGIREFIRCDSNYTIDDFTFDHNTCNAITSASNSYGIFYMRGTFTNTCAVTNNLWLNLAESYVYTSATSGRYVVGASVFSPTTSTGNYWYNTGYDSEDKDNNVFSTGWPYTSAVSGGALLDSDPCYDSTRGNFYVSDADVFNAGVGDPRWLADYVAPEAEELSVVDYGTTWDCTDTKTLYDEADETIVHNNLKFIVEDNPITVSDAGIYFTSKSSLMTYSGMPTDCALAFLVNGPGSVVVSTSGSWNTQLEVSYAPYDESTGQISSTFTTVGGAVSAGVEEEYISLLDVPEDGSEVYIVYLYVSSPMYLTGLSWVKDIAAGVDTSLSAPENVTISPDSFVVGTTDNVTISWDEVTGAGSYTVYSVSEEADNEVLAEGITGTSYSFDPSDLTVGSYSYAVQANPAEGSIRTDSEISEAVTLTVESNWTTVPDDAVTEWSFDTWEDCHTLYGDQLTDDTVYTDGYLNFCNGGGSGFKFATTNYSEEAGAQYRVQLGGSGTAEKCCLQFMVTTSGTLKVSTISSGTTTRYLQAYVNGTATGDTMLAESTGDASYPSEREVYLSVSGQSTIAIASTSGGVNIFTVTWTPIALSGDDSPEVNIPSDSDAIETAYITDYSNEGSDAGYANIEDGATLTVNKITYAGAMTWDSSRYKFGGASKVGDDGIPTSRYASFKITTPGTITHKVISGSSSDAERAYDVILVKTVNGEQVVTTLYRDYSPTSSSSDALTTTVSAYDLYDTTETATVYIYTEANTNLYQVGFTPSK